MPSASSANPPVAWESNQSLRYYCRFRTSHQLVTHLVQRHHGNIASRKFRLPKAVRFSGSGQRITKMFGRCMIIARSWSDSQRSTDPTAFRSSERSTHRPSLQNKEWDGFG